MIVTEKNIQYYVKTFVETKGLNVKGMKHDPNKDIKLLSMGNKPTWHAIFEEVGKGNQNKMLHIYIDAVSAEATIRDERIVS